jgi:hypothetical protein
MFIFFCTKFPTILNEYGGINHIDICSSQPYNVVASHASRVK